jgi:hypothetical protein
MTIKSWLLALLLTSLASIAWSKETNVPPGVNTLSDAIAAASDRDTLILGWGGYGGGSADITVNKSLTIRSVNRTTESVIASNSFVIQGAGISVVLQGIRFSISNFSINQAAEVKILENTFTNTIYLDSYRTTEGDGSLFIIGNHFLSGAINSIRSDNAYIAGNILEDGYIGSWVPVWIVGNDVRLSSMTCGDAIGVYQAQGSVQVIANRVTNNRNNSCGSNYSSGIHVNGSLALVAGNIVRLNCNNVWYFDI